jgi:hypothetical protein
MKKKRSVARSTLIAMMIIVGAGTTTTAPALAATSRGEVYHADGNLAGAVQFNSGYHRGHAGVPEDGFNSFQIQDDFCGDEWGVGVQWQLNDDVRTQQTVGDCEPAFIMYETGQATNIVTEFSWRPYMWSLNDPGLTEYGEWTTDWMGSNSDNEGDTDLFTRSTVYADLIDGVRPTFTASMWPTALARVFGPWVTGPMLRDLEERTPLPPFLTEDERDSIYKQMWCHLEFGRFGKGGPTWDLETSRANIPWREVVRDIRDHECNWD